jgi:hypothetical protein
MENDLSAAAELAKRFATEAACRDYLIQLRWPDGFRCPVLGVRRFMVTKGEPRPFGGKRPEPICGALQAPGVGL